MTSGWVDFSLTRKPYRAPFGGQFTVELHDCHDQVIRFVDLETRQAGRTSQCFVC